MSGTEFLKNISESEKNLFLLEAELAAFEDVHSKTTSASLQKKLSKIIRAIEKETENLAKLKIEGFNLINTLDDFNQRCVLTYHFICNMPFSDITYTMNYSQRHIMRIYEKACNNVNEHFAKQKHSI